MRSIREIWQKVATFVFMACAISILAVPQASANTAAANWLQANINQDGSYWLATDVATPLQSNSEAINALAVVSPDADTSPAIQYLINESYQSSEYLARKIIAVRAAGGSVTESVNALVQLQNADGGFGELSGYDSTALDTAFALLAFNKAAYSNSAVISSALNFLVQQQQADGGFPLKQPNESGVYNTAIVAMAMQKYLLTYNAAGTVQRAADYILGKKIIGAGWETDWETATSLMALVSITTDSSLYKSGIDTLTASQLADGSWGGDIYITALAVQAMAAASNVQLPTDPTIGSVTGKIIDADNIAPAPLGGVTVIATAVDSGESYSANSSSDGSFILKGAVSGDYTLTFSLAGYTSVTQSTSVQAGEIVNLGIIRLSALPDTAILQGVVTDTDGSVIPGATINITGAIDTTFQADVAGQYRVVVVPGEIVLNVAADGYQSITANATISAGQTTDFSPTLVPVDETSTIDTVEISGTVIDFETGMAVDGAFVHISGSSTQQTNTDANGNFSIAGIAAGQVEIYIGKRNYKDANRTVVAVPGSKIDLGKIYMLPEVWTATTTVTGAVTDSNTGLPVSGATVMVDGSIVSVATDANGHYEISGVDQTRFGLSVSATGYLSDFASINVVTPTNVTVDFALTVAGAGGISIDSLSSDQNIYDAYQNAAITLAIKNDGNYSQIIIPKLELLDSDGQLVRQLVFVGSDPTGGTEESSVVMPGATMNVNANWYIGQLAPGDYTIHCLVFDKYTSQLLAEKEIVRTVRATQDIEKLTLKTDPQYAVVDEIAQIKFYADVTNKSNVDNTITIFYELSSPSGATIYSGSKTLDIKVNDATKTFTVDELQHTFTESGVYPLSVHVTDGAVPVEMETVPISVSPSTRINVEQNITPNTITPDGDKRITINIRLEGVETK